HTPLRCTPFPYTTLFRSRAAQCVQRSPGSPVPALSQRMLGRRWVVSLAAACLARFPSWGIPLLRVVAALHGRHGHDRGGLLCGCAFDVALDCRRGRSGMRWYGCGTVSLVMDGQHLIA